VRRPAALAVAAVLLLPAGGATAAVRVRTDTGNFMRFRLAGTHLTVRPLLNDRALWGERVRAECATAHRGRLVGGVRVWPRHAATVTFRLAPDISRRVRVCRLESAPTRVVIATVTFPRG
jgi:hypothetical protein